MPRRYFSVTVRGRRRLVGRAWALPFALILGLCALWAAAGARAASADLETWRRNVREARVLAENDAPKAQAQAVRLQATLPKDATPPDRARVLNLLARAEI